MMQRERIPQRQGGNVERAIENERRIETAKAPQLGQHPEHHATQEAQRRQQLLRGEVTIGQQPDQKR